MVNPFASSVTARTRVMIQTALAGEHHRHTVDVVETRRRGHATRFAQDAANRGVDVVAVLGGDGTLNEAAQGLLGTPTALAPLPGGSTNVFARTIGLPNEPVPAARATVAALDDPGAIRRVGVATVNGRVVLFHVGIGFDAAVVEEVERRGSLKRWAGHPLFVAAALRTWRTGYDHHRPRMRVTAASIDGTTVTTVADSRFTVVMNTSPYTFLGNRALDLAPAADLDHPLSVVAFRTLRARTLLAELGRVLAGGSLATRGRRARRILRIDGCTAVTVEGYGPVPYQVDGDHLGASERFDIRWHPERLRLVIPVAAPPG